MTRLVLAAAAFGGLVAAIPADAQQPACYSYNGVHVQQQVVGNYNYYAHKVVANDVAVAPLIVTVPVESRAVPVYAYGSAYYYSVSEAYREKAYIREVIREELKAFAGGNAPQPDARPPSPAVVPAPKGGPPITAGPEPEVLDDVTPPDLQQKLLTAYQGKGNCLSCHGNGQASGKFRLTNEQGQLLKLSSDKRWKVYAMSSVGAMPPSAASDASKAMEAANLPVLLQYAAIK